MRKKWFYVDITTTCHERVAVKAVDEEEAKDLAGYFVDGGVIDFSKANEFEYGSVHDSIVLADKHYHAPPKGMRKFENEYAARPLEDII